MNIKISDVTIILLILFAFSLYSQSIIELPFTNVTSVIYDNDDHRDVYTDEYLIALSHLGEIELKGIITTYAANDREYDLFVIGRQDIVDKARLSGLKNLPQVMAGTNKRLSRPASNKIEDTTPLDLAASKFIIEQAQKASPENPIIFVAGGQLTVIANAYLLEPSISNKVIVSGIFGVNQKDYNAGLDEWAWKIVLSQFRVFAVPIGPSHKRGTVYMKPPHVPKNRIKEELPQELLFFRWMFEKKHPSNSLPDEHDYDGQAAIPLMCPDYITHIRRWSVVDINDEGNLILKQDDNGKIYEALDANQNKATFEFWRAMTSTVNSLN
jgi:inosine-uridine nucleoside N-ribohydrolase